MCLQDDAGAGLEAGGLSRRVFLESQGKTAKTCSGMQGHQLNPQDLGLS